MAHPLVLAMFDSADGAAAGARAAHRLGVAREQLSVVARSHDVEGELARRIEATPGVEIEDSRPAALLGELGAQLVAAIAIVMPGIGPIVAAGPLAAEFGEAAGHAAGDISRIVRRAGVDEERAEAWEAAIERGSVLLGVHAEAVAPGPVAAAMEASGARETVVGRWA